MTPQFEPSPIVNLIETPIDKMTPDQLNEHIAKLRQVQNANALKVDLKKQPSTTPRKSAKPDFADLDALAEAQEDDDDYSDLDNEL